MAKFTKGEWKVVEETPNRNRIYIEDGKRRYSVYALYGHFVNTDEVTVEEAQANARLIAAAPDLYEALKAYQTANLVHNDAEQILYYLGDFALRKAGPG
jgi:hypothetical protein